jgi:hypothetical protein
MPTLPVSPSSLSAASISLADRPERAPVIALRRRTAPPQQDAAGVVERDELDLAAAKVYADT